MDIDPGGHILGEKFEINKALENGRPTARFPEPSTGLGQFVTDPQSYLEAIKATAGAISKEVGGPIMEVLKSLGVAPSAYSFTNMSFMPDPANAGLLPWPGIAPESLRKIARENIAPQLVIRSRVTDVASFSGLSTRLWEPGWTIALRESSDTPTTQDKRDIKEAERFVWNCNRDVMDDARERDAHNIHPFDDFMRRFADDTFTFDGWSVWTDMDRTGRIKGFAPLPAGNIRLAIPGKGYNGDPRYFAALVDDVGNPVMPFTRDEMFWAVRNPRNDPQTFGYGWCFDETTEVMTRKGWKLFSDVQFTDELASMSVESQKFEWQEPTAKIWQPYVGRMYRFSSASIDMLVTPQHRMLVHRYPGGPLTVMSAEDVFKARAKYKKNNNWRIPVVSSWSGENIGVQNFQSDKIRSLPVSMSGDDYCALMGMYLSEGYVPNNVNQKNLYICQKDTSKGYKPFKEVLTRILGSAPYYTKGEFVVCRTSLSEHVKQFGKDCYTKYVPELIKNATPRQIQIFLHFYTLGDGRTTDRRNRFATSNRRGRLGGVFTSITTSSRKMADDIQELYQKTGFAASINVRAAYVGRMQHTATKADGSTREYDYHSQKVESYTVYPRGAKECGFVVSEERYAGNVGCASVPNGTLLVRRNNKIAWAGNCETEIAIRMLQAFENGIELNAATFTKNSMPNGMLLMKGDFFNQSQIDALMREFTNMKRGISKSWGVPVMSVPDDAEVEILNFMDMKGQEIRYKDHLNLMGGIYCVISQFPPRRIGIFASGHTRDNAPLPNESLAIAGVDDPGIAPLLNFFAMRMNEYVIWPNWPKLMFKFNGASPKQDAREYEERAKARVWKESRNDVDLPPLERGAPKWIRPVLDLMDYAPQDPGLAGIYQTLAVKMLELQFGPDETEGGEGGGGGSEEEVGAPFPSKTDAAASETHGHASGVRRDSAKEESNAKPNTPAGAKIGPSSVA